MMPTSTIWAQENNKVSTVIYNTWDNYYCNNGGEIHLIFNWRFSLLVVLWNKEKLKHTEKHSLIFLNELCFGYRILKKSLHTSQAAHQAGAYPRFCSMKRFGMFLLPPGWDASPSQGYIQHLIRRHSFIHLGGDKHCEGKVSSPGTQPSVPGQVSIQRRAQ